MRTPVTCPRCGAEVAADQSWCTECGLAARTRLASTPNWRAPLIAAGAIGVACIAALIVAFVVLTGDNAPVPSTSSTPAPAVPTATTPAAPAPTATTVTVPAPVPTVPVPTVSIPTVSVPTVTVPPTTTG